ncbi:MAG: epoxyqueuosine reductase QueH [Chloroflexi bacterium]|nr:epoxyqueuosine reductase QueH [Chloroflexota bacterium]
MKILLHICCGVCATGVVDRLLQEGHEVTGFFFNPNIHPSEEYSRRLDVAYRVSREMGYLLKVGDYRPQEWLKETLPFRNDPEGGRRCEVCFRIRLRETYRQLSELGGDMFATTLTVSPHKPAKAVNRIGKEIGGELFLERDFKKREGFKRSIELAKQWNLYRQDYCGCIYSFRERRDKDEPKDQGV